MAVGDGGLGIHLLEEERAKEEEAKRGRWLVSLARSRRGAKGKDDVRHHVSKKYEGETRGKDSSLGYIVANHDTTL